MIIHVIMTTAHKRKHITYDTVSFNTVSSNKIRLVQSFPQFASNHGTDLYRLAKSHHFELKDIDKAVMLYEITAQFGNTDAMFDLAICYRDGIGVDRDKKRAFQLLEDASILGNNRANYDIARMYQCGEGVEQDMFKSIKYYKLADASGCIKAKNNLARCYEIGDGVDQDINKAFRMRKDAFNKINKNDNENADAHNVIIYNLARCYEKGIGVDQNIHYAMQLYHAIVDVADDVSLKLSHYYKTGINADTKKSHDYREYERA
jgi:TPR repeat protein